MFIISSGAGLVHTIEHDELLLAIDRERGVGTSEPSGNT